MSIACDNMLHILPMRSRYAPMKICKNEHILCSCQKIYARKEKNMPIRVSSVLPSVPSFRTNAVKFISKSWYIKNSAGLRSVLIRSAALCLIN